LWCWVLRSRCRCQYSITVALPVPLQGLYRKCMSSGFFIFKRVRHFACDHTAAQQSHTSLDSVQAGTQLSYSCSSSLQ
jgi:hypothetical protein